MTSDDPADFEPQWEAAAEYGLASLVLGATACLLAMLGVVAAVLSHDQCRRWDRIPQVVAGACGYLACAGMAGLAVAGVAAGRRSVRAAEARRLPTARGWAGVLLGGFGLFLAVGAAGCWTGVVGNMAGW